MEQNLNDKPLSNMQITRYIESLKKEMNFDDEVYGLVKSDLEDGLTQEQTEKYLRETIDSILNQTYHNYEVIFWDNQSTDSTASIIKSYKNERFNFYYAPKHTTLGEARNLALDKKIGMFPPFLDSDDVWERDFLERAVGVLSIYKNKFSFYYSNYYSWIDGEELVEYNTEKNSGNRTFKDLLSKYMVGMSAAVINGNSMKIDDIKFDFKYQLVEDYDFFLRLIYKNDAYYDARPLMKYRMHSDSLTVTQKAGWGKEFMCLYTDLIYNLLSVDEIQQYSEELKWLKVRSVNADVEYLILHGKKLAVLRMIIQNLRLSFKLLIRFSGSNRFLLCGIFLFLLNLFISLPDRCFHLIIMRIKFVSLFCSYYTVLLIIELVILAGIKECEHCLSIMDIHNVLLTQPHISDILAPSTRNSGLYCVVIFFCNKCLADCDI